MAATASEIDAQAASWAARIDRGPLTPDEDRLFQAWLENDVRCLGAYGRMRAIALGSERARALGPDFNPALFVPTPRRQVLQWGSAIAATLVIGVTGTWQVLRRRDHFSTAKGETRVVALQDGSVVTLNTASEIAVNYSDKLRGVELLRGEALFDVAKNKQRPFVVTAGDTHVRAVGTSFSVRHLDETPVQVLVREGIVDVFKPDGVAPVRITANTMALSPADGLDITARMIPATQLHRRMAWEAGQIAFEGENLAQAADEFSRYSDTRLVVEGEALRREEIAGLFKATDPVGFAKTVAISLNAHVRIGEGEVHLSR